MKLIFLDIDWVLHPFFSDQDFVKECVDNLKEIINETGAYIIISSDWKYWLEKLHKKWIENKLTPYLWHTDRIYANINYNIYDQEKVREKEILNFLEVTKISNDKLDTWCVIDDNVLGIDNLVLVNPKTWLDKENVKQAIKILKRET